MVVTRIWKGALYSHRAFLKFQTRTVDFFILHKKEPMEGKCLQRKGVLCFCPLVDFITVLRTGHTHHSVHSASAELVPASCFAGPRVWDSMGRGSSSVS